MKIEEGKSYRLRSGEIVGPIKLDVGGEWSVTHPVNHSYNGFWTKKGKCSFFLTFDNSKYPEYDIVEEYVP